MNLAPLVIASHGSSNHVGLKFHVAHPPSDDRTRCDRAQNISRSTRNEQWRPKSWGTTQKKRFIGKEIVTHNGIGWLLCANWSIYMSRIEPRCWFFDPTSVRWDIAANRNWHFQFICYFSPIFEDTIVPIVSFDPSSNSPWIQCLTLLQAVVCTTRFTKWRSHHGQKMDPPYRNYR